MTELKINPSKCQMKPKIRKGQRETLRRPNNRVIDLMTCNNANKGKQRQGKLPLLLLLLLLFQLVL